jgi:hypothetical protein
MRFQLTGDWPGPGNNYLPAGTVIDTDSPAFAWLPWRQMGDYTFPIVPLTVVALDQAAADALAVAYPDQLHRLMAAPPAVIRKLINV